MPAARWRIIAAYAAVYILWGSGYLAIRVAVDTLPALGSAGLRFLLAGVILLGWARLRGLPLPSRVDWRSGAVSAVFMFLLSAGGIAWASQYIPSGIVALMNATLPIWMVLLNWLVYRSVRPVMVTFIGLALGMAGMLLLIEPGDLQGGSVHLLAILALVGAPLFWALGSLQSRRNLGSRAPLVTLGMQLLMGGLMLIGFGALNGEFVTFQLADVNLPSLVALAYLVVGNSIIAFSSYTWLMQVDSPARVSTYAFVNPVVALFLGVVVAHETLTPRTVIAALVILSGVLVIIYPKRLTLPRWRRVQPAAPGIKP